MVRSHKLYTVTVATTVRCYEGTTVVSKTVCAGAFSQGDVLGKVFELGGTKCALLICYDVEFPEAVREVCMNSQRSIHT